MHATGAKRQLGDSTAASYPASVVRNSGIAGVRWPLDVLSLLHLSALRALPPAGNGTHDGVVVRAVRLRAEIDPVHADSVCLRRAMGKRACLSMLVLVGDAGLEPTTSSV